MTKIRTRRFKLSTNHNKLLNVQNKLVFFIILLTFCSNSSSSLNVKLKFSGITKNMLIMDSANSVSTAMSDVIREFYIANGINFDFIVYGEKSHHMNDVIDGITNQISRDKPVTLKHIPDINKWDHKMKQSAVIFIKSEANFYKLHKTMKFQRSTMDIIFLTNIVPERLKFLVYIDELKSFQNIYDFITSEMDPTLMMTAEMRFYELLMTSDENFINLAANLLYSEDKCGSFVPKVLNKFDKHSQKWVNKLENFNHFENFQGCLLRFIVSFHYSLYIEGRVDIAEIYRNTQMLPEILSDKNTKFGGSINEIVQWMARKNNFTFHYTFAKQLVTQSISYYGCRNYNADLSVGILFQSGSINRKELYYQYSEPYGVFEFYYLVTENDLYTNYEKLLFPFDVTTWILLLITHGLTFGCIFGLHLCPRWIRQIVFGRGEQIMKKKHFLNNTLKFSGINRPAFNALGIFFGISQFRLPRESFCRFILLLFIWFCLMFRTCYQSKLFEFMTSDMRKPLPASIEDLIKYNYTIITLNDSYYLNIIDEINNGRER
jgi:hypothetical protein